MTYSGDDLSVHDGNPTELYKFVGPSAALTFFYASTTVDVTHDGDLYTAVPIERDRIQVTDQSKQQQIGIRMPVSLALVQAYAFETPPRTLTVTIFRMHGAGAPDPINYWIGKVLGFSVDGDVATALLTSLLDDAIKTEVSAVWYQGLCNHVLFDPRCAIVATVPNGRRVDTTVASVLGDTVTLNADGGADQFHKAGEIVRVTDGERRLIIDHTGLVLTLSRAFRELDPTDAVQVFAGCDHTKEVCRDKFANIINYGGHPYIPTRDAFRLGLKGV